MKNKTIVSNLKPVFCAEEKWTTSQQFGPCARPHYILGTVLDGKGILQIRNEIFHLSKGSLFLLKPQQKCYMESDEYTPWQIAWCAFSGDEAAEVLFNTVFSKSSVCRYKEDTKKLFSYFLHLIDVFEKEYSKDLEITGALLQLISCILPKELQRGAENKEHYLARAKEYIENNFCYDIRIQDIAHQIGIDRSYVYRIFMELEQIAPKDYLLNCRLNHAKKMLEETNRNIIEIAYAYGFSDLNSLNYHFKHIYKISPEEFRWKLMHT